MASNTVISRPTVQDAFKYTREQIVAHITNIRNTPAAFCADQEYLRPVVLPARAASGTIPAAPAETLDSQLLQATNVIIYLATTKIAVYPLPLKINGSYDPTKYNKAGTPKFLTHDYQLELIHLTFDGVRLPVNTIYDILGWILSITWARPGAQATDADYYFPLLALYSKWCRVLTGANKNAPAMTHIAWWKSAPSSAACMLLGCTLGTDNQRPELLTRWRQLYMDDLKFTAQNENQRITVDGKDEAPGYGKCAETFFWIYAKTKSPIPANVKGLALDPTDIPFAKLTEFSPSVAARALRQPCGSCRHLITQIDKDWQWKTSFDVKKLLKALTKTPAPVLDENNIPDTENADSNEANPVPTGSKGANQSSTATKVANMAIQHGLPVAGDAIVDNSPALLGAVIASALPKTKSTKK